jgi:hypothetical protein
MQILVATCPARWRTSPLRLILALACLPAVGQLDDMPFFDLDPLAVVHHERDFEPEFAAVVPALQLLRAP